MLQSTYDAPNDADEGSEHVKRIAISQSNYIPWKGYFHVIGSVDEFVLYDEVQYTKRDWRNRNVIKTENGPVWLTIPVQVRGKYHQRIDETMIADPGWARSHWDMINRWYSGAASFERYSEAIAGFYRTTDQDCLSGVNREMLELLMALLGIGTRLSSSNDYPVVTEDRTDRLVSICLQADATEYWTGPAARAYLDESRFDAAGIELMYIDYSGFPEYPQLHGPFRHEVSVIDLLLNAGERSAELLNLDGVL